MARARAAVRGRDQELAVLRAASAADGGRLVVLKGPAGIGRSALLEEAERMLGAAGVRVLAVRPGRGGDGSTDDAPEGGAEAGRGGDGGDPYALAPLVGAVRDRFEQFQDAGLAAPLGALARIGDAVRRDGGGWAPAMVIALDELFGRLGRRGRVALLADDVQEVAEPAPVLTAARRAGCLVLAACEESAQYAPGVAELLAAADQVVTLGPLDDEVAEALTRRLPGPRLDEAVPGVLRTALGPLFGNPGTLLGTLADLRGRGRLAVFRGRLCLRAPQEPVELPAGHHLLRRTRSFGAPAVRLLSSLAVWDGFGVTDLPLLAEVTGTDLTECGRLLDRLIDAEVLVADAAGRVSCRCPALAAAAVRLPDARRGAALHASVAERLLSRRRTGGADPMALADHIARGGPAVALGRPRIGWLLGLAADAEREQPERAARWCLAALARLSPGDPDHARTLTRLLNLVVRTGRYELLRDVLAGYAERGCAPASLTEIRLAAILLALHTGEPPAEEAVRSLLDEAVTDREPAGFAQWWFGRPLTGGGGRGAVFAAETGGAGSPGEARGAVPVAGTGGVAAPMVARDAVRTAGLGEPLTDARDAEPAAGTGGSTTPTHARDALLTAHAGGAPAPTAPRDAEPSTPKAPRNAEAPAPTAPQSTEPPAPADPRHPCAASAPELMDLLSTALFGDLGACERVWHRPVRTAASRRAGRSHAGPEQPAPVAPSVADLATLTHLVLGARYRNPGTGVLGVYRRVVDGYTAVDWSGAMSAARELELSSGEATLAHQAARLFAADMCAARGEARQAAEWLADVRPVPGLAGPRSWVRIGLLSRAGDDRRAALLALRVSRRLRRAGVHAGLHLLLMRAVRIAAFADDHDGAADLLEEVELLCGDTGTDTSESLLLARGLVGRDVEQARQAVELARNRGDLPSVLDTCLVIARFAEDPRPWLREAHELATRCGASSLLERVRAVTRERGVPAPRSRGRREAPAVTERRIIDLIGEGLTNRQIALRLQISEKTVENHLTRLFARTGCRSRVELVAASLGGRLGRATT
ncbi:LuxR C-terminal-related transcriptional regulator [Streptomyces griseoviridis]|uniref:HTH luxR-type domain-containing protein n=1 Tax=Streptomyces griseoviridis TaxID=45398 RepID=A0A918GVU3_STRGD|nr:helix-turn-helix transcriptional regulator [Streptomyces niveoruber]GGS62445.1 hypothetical protein GCM10010238_59500 [Streptomyces niveoruber]